MEVLFLFKGGCYYINLAQIQLYRFTVFRVLFKSSAHKKRKLLFYSKLIRLLKGDRYIRITCLLCQIEDKVFFNQLSLLNL